MLLRTGQNDSEVLVRDESLTHAPFSCANHDTMNKHLYPVIPRAMVTLVSMVYVTYMFRSC